MKLDTIKLLQESFNVNESVAKELLKTLDPIMVARLISEKMGKPINVTAETPKAKATKADKTKKVTRVERVRAALAAYSKNSPVSASDIAEASGLDRKACSDILWGLWKKGEVESSEVGIYVTK